MKDSSAVYVSSSGNDATGDGTRGNPYATLTEAHAKVNEGGTIYLLDDITLTGVGINKYITITTAPGVEETAVIKRGQPSGAIETLIGLTQKGQLTLKNIIIDGGFNNQSINGRLINVYEGSKLIIEEGTVLRNSNSQYHGSAIQIRDNGSVVEMKGGEIRGNSNSQGAAVLVDTGTQFIMTGGLITDNIGGGVQSRGGQIFLSGEAYITGNTFAGKVVNVNLANNKTLTLNGVFTGEAGITTQNMAPGTQFGQATEESLGSIENLIADSGALLASYDQNNVLVWRLVKNELSQPSTDGEITGTRPTLIGETEPLAKVTIKIVSAADSSLLINEERVADENGKWELPIVDALNTGAYTIDVTANKNKTQSDTVTRQFTVVDKSALQTRTDQIKSENLVAEDYTPDSWEALQQALQQADTVLKDPAATQEQVNAALTALNNAYDGLQPNSSAVDKTKLQAKVNEIEAEHLAADDYTTDSWEALQQALQHADTVLKDPAATQEQVNAALTALNNAYDGLQPVPSAVDKTKLQAKVNEIEAEHLAADDYTTDSWEALQQALQHADTVLKDPAATQEQVNAALTALNNAYDGLQPVPSAVDKTKLQAKVNEIEAEHLAADDYTTDSWEALQQALQYADTVLKDPAATQEQVNAALTALNNAYDGLQPVPSAVDKTKLQAKVNEIEAEHLAADNYTTDSWEALQQALQHADTVLKDPAATQEQVNAALTALNNAYDGLQPVPSAVDKTKLQAKVNEIEAEHLVADDYTTDSWEALQQALQHADTVLKDPAATQEQVNAALTALNNAYDGLQPVPSSVDKSKLQAKTEQIKSENLKAEDYTSTSWTELQQALQKAETVLADPNATQQEVNEALSSLTKARDGLKKPGQPTPAVDKSKLQAKTEQIKSEDLKAEDYTSESWAELQNALQKAKTVLADPYATQQEVDKALTALVTAYEGLDKVSTEVDKSKLRAKTEQIQSENLSGEDYTSESWEELQNALRKAAEVLADRHATQQEVDEALSALTKARAGLKKPGEPAVDKSDLQAKADEIDDEDLDEDDYTASSWRKLEKALKRAKEVLEDPDATQDEVDEALAELKKARRGLESVDKRDRDREKDRESADHVQNPIFTGGGSSHVEPKPSEPAKEESGQTGYMNGYPTGNFDPNRQVTRAEMATILVNTGMVNPETSASGTFFDVADLHWAANAIKRANEAGLMNGYANGTFNPEGGITRAEMATIVYKYLGLSGDDMPNNFYDVPADHWASQIIAAVSKEGYMAGYPDGTFHPQKTLTRAETVTIINRLTNKIQLSPVKGQSWPDVPPTHWAYKDIEAATKK
ncbi:S-layer homology domain-containing protein [Brevibacillus brevis]|uniref:S-layer homology domain-containing protein n=1 Tax=Brevibacillus brevis TaxID=1393 RepID=A0ABY9T3X8_BREBE|nr:S-layer homology domain-containing protein [Brevibacillus brevis]WNC14799.1 S-layer homology domain-containing protein [Brevibacillus brevis]